MSGKSGSELQKHMLGTYFGLRMGLAVIGILLPLVVLASGWRACHVGLQGSLSAYYHIPELTTCTSSLFTARDFFVGGLFAAAACLYLYKGFSTAENVALNLGGVFAALVALLPTGNSVVHGPAAVLFFVCIAYVALFRSRDTVRLLPESKRGRYTRLYRSLGIAMIAFPAAAVALSFASGDWGTTIFWIESLGVWAFSAYWLTKTAEMHETKAEKRAAHADLPHDGAPAHDAPRPAPATADSGAPS